MSKFDNGYSYGFGAIVFAAVLAAVVSSAGTYLLTSGKTPEIAVVDLQRVVVASKDVAALKSERDTQIQELKKMADAANKKLESIKDEAIKKKTSEKYLAEINSKKEEFDKIYASALQASDQKLNDVIKSVADKEDAEIVFNKASLVQGGTDITESVIDLVK